MRAIEASHVCRVLAEDPDLAEAVPPAVREQAVGECLARTVTLPEGPWTPAAGEAPERGIGLLVMGGLLVRRVGVHGGFAAELLGAGDLLRPWQGEDEPTLVTTTRWQAIEPICMAVLDEPFACQLTRYPSLSGRLVERALERSRNLAVSMAIIQQARVDMRLHMLFWHLAARWGRVRSDGVRLPLRLTHNMLAELVAARRPTVTSALSTLARRGAVLQLRDAWLLRGDPPAALGELAPMSHATAHTGHEGSAPLRLG
jgi:CRP/FNR family transcriptional regulator, cyclic AMP receptor protein